MGKIHEKDVLQICDQFGKLDPSNCGKITLPHLLGGTLWQSKGEPAGVWIHNCSSTEPCKGKITIFAQEPGKTIQAEKVLQMLIKGGSDWIIWSTWNHIDYRGRGGCSARINSVS